MSVDPTVAAAVWRALKEYVGRADRPIRESALRRWRDACGIGNQEKLERTSS